MYCKQGIIGAQFSHPQRGHAMCCATGERFHDTPKVVWQDRLAPVRKLLSENQKIAACSSCYHQEEQKVISFRQLYNKQFEKVSTGKLPRHLDLDLSNFCNLKCIMCDYTRSSTWAKESGKFKDTKGVTEINESTLDQICELSHDLQHLTLQGGEPSMIPQYVTYFDYLKKNKIMPNVHLVVVTNLTNLKEKFYSYMPEFKSVNISVSVDAYGEANNFIRYPSNFEQVTKNIKELVNQRNNMSVKVHSALQILSMFNIKDFADWFVDLERFYQSKKRYIGQYIQHVHEPEELCIMNAPTNLKHHFVDQIRNTGFSALADSINLDNEYDYSRTVNYVRKICDVRRLQLEKYLPAFSNFY